MVGREHHADRRERDVEGVVAVRERLGVGDLPADVEAETLGLLLAGGEELGREVGRQHARAGACGRDRGVAGARGDVDDGSSDGPTWAASTAIRPSSGITSWATLG